MGIVADMFRYFENCSRWELDLVRHSDFGKGCMDSG